MSEDNISKIKDRVDVVDLIGGYLKLQKAGINYKAPCPFHNEKTPSFFVSPERQTWRCFGCNVGGDIFSFVQQIEGVEFPEALRILAKRAGVELTYVPRENQDNKVALLEISELAAKFFEKQLYGSATGKLALAYLKDRGLSDESIKKFRLGFAPDSWNGLYDFLARKFDDREIFDAGLAVKKDNGGYYDRFRSRIMFPIFDINGIVVGFTGRIFSSGGGSAFGGGEEPAKYVNTPQTAIYDKSRVLYGLNLAKLDMRKANRCLLVEGNMDVIMSHQAGASFAVATSGTALTEGQLKLIKRYSENLDLCFDADSAGERATARGVDLALAQGFNVGVVAINEPDVKDPADYVKKHGTQWAEYATKSKPFLDFYFDKFRTGLDLATGSGKKIFTQKLLPLVAAIFNKIEQNHWVQAIALALKTNESLIQAELAAIKPKALRYEAEPHTPIEVQPQGAVLDVHEESLLALILRKPQLVEFVTPEYEVLISDRVRACIAPIRGLLSKAVSAQDKGSSQIVAALSGASSNPQALAIEFAYLKSQEFWKDFGDEEIVEEFKKLLNLLKKRSIVATLENLEYEIKEAENQGDKARLAELVAAFTKTSGQL